MVPPDYASAEVMQTDVHPMNTQRGFVQLSAMAWGAIAAGVVMLGMVVALKVQTHRLETCKAEFAMFKAQVEALGLAAEKAAKEKEAKDKLAKEKADAENARTTATLAATVKRLRDANSRRSTVSAPAPFAASPDRICLDPNKLTSAVRSFGEGIGRFVDGVLGIVVEGSQAVIDLDSAKRWAQAL